MDEPILLEDGGVILGAVPTFVPYSSAEYSIESGDLIVFFTDGVTEAMNPDQTEEYEEHRLVECVNAHRNLDADGIMKAIIRDINQFANNIQYDDITMIILKVN